MTSSDWAIVFWSQHTNWVVHRFSNPCIGANVFWSQPASWVVRSFIDFRILVLGRSFFGASLQAGSFGRPSRCRILWLGAISGWRNFYRSTKGPMMGDPRPATHELIHCFFIGDRTMAQPGPWLAFIWTRPSTLGKLRHLYFDAAGRVIFSRSFDFLMFLLNRILFVFIWTNPSKHDKLRSLYSDPARRIDLVFFCLTYVFFWITFVLFSFGQGHSHTTH